MMTMMIYYINNNNTAANTFIWRDRYSLSCPPAKLGDSMWLYSSVDTTEPASLLPPPGYMEEQIDRYVHTEYCVELSHKIMISNSTYFIS